MNTLDSKKEQVHPVSHPSELPGYRHESHNPRFQRRSIEDRPMADHWRGPLDPDTQCNRWAASRCRDEFQLAVIRMNKDDQK